MPASNRLNGLHGVIVPLACVFLAGCSATSEHVRALRSDDAEARRNAAFELQALGPRAKRAIPALTDAAQSKDPELRRIAIEAIGGCGKAAWEANRVVTFALRDEDVHVRRAAVVAMGRFEKFPSSAFPFMVDCLGDPDSLMRELTMNTFEDLGPNAVGTLIGALNDSCAVVRRGAARTLGRLGNDAYFASNALRKARTDQDPAVSRYADEALRRMNSQN